VASENPLKPLTVDRPKIAAGRRPPNMAARREPAIPVSNMAARREPEIPVSNMAACGEPAMPLSNMAARRELLNFFIYLFPMPIFIVCADSFRFLFTKSLQ